MTEASKPIETSKLAGLALDYWVAVADGQRAEKFSHEGRGWVRLVGVGVPYAPSTLWAQAGPIIEREHINLTCVWDPSPLHGPGPRWLARHPGPDGNGVLAMADTPLIAAMRAFVAAKLGPSVS
ncbi:phage protein NinX family protein [Variovorax sp. 38R]|uniref:phage protein NinX family protein n=1 Tax=Variovorax sp. 38R TaxID=2774875 RepID=UPI00177CD2B3|nr:phage protein NinX family protein [Variovorax sp. 38R]QOF80310.1 DUF2591 family protein [Variovorax sp. 38R]